MEKIFVLDTNVLIHNPQSMFAFDEHRVVIPIVVIEEIVFPAFWINDKTIPLNNKYMGCREMLANFFDHKT